MNLKIDSKLLSWIGFGLMVLGLIVSYVKVANFDFGMSGSSSKFIGMSLLFKMGSLGELSGFAYVIAIVAIAVTAYAGYVAFVKPSDYMKAALAGAAAFVILLVGYYILKGALTKELGEGMAFLSGLIGQMFKMGFATWLYLLGAVAFFLSARGYRTTTLTSPEVIKEETLK